MGFGNFLKKALNPLTPFRPLGAIARNAAHGNLRGAVRSSLLGPATMGLVGGGYRRPPQIPQQRDSLLVKTLSSFPQFAQNAFYRDPGIEAYSQPPQVGGANVAQAALSAFPGFNQSAPATALAPPVQPGGWGPKPGNPNVGGAVASMFRGGQPMPPTPVDPSGETNPYEIWKANGRRGPRPVGY